MEFTQNLGLTLSCYRMVPSYFKQVLSISFPWTNFTLVRVLGDYVLPQPARRARSSRPQQYPSHHVNVVSDGSPCCNPLVRPPPGIQTDAQAVAKMETCTDQLANCASLLGKTGRCCHHCSRVLRIGLGYIDSSSLCESEQAHFAYDLASVFWWRL